MPRLARQAVPSLPLPLLPNRPSTTLPSPSTIPPFIALRPLQKSRKFPPTPTGHSKNPHAAVPHPARPSRNGPVYRGGPFSLPEGDRACATSSPPALPHHGQLARTFHLCPSVPHLWLPLPLPLVSAFLIGVHSWLPLLPPLVAEPALSEANGSLFLRPSPLRRVAASPARVSGSKHGHLRVISGSKRGRFGVVLGSLWGRFGVTLGSV